MKHAGKVSMLLLGLISLAAPAYAQNVIPQWDCCAYIYSTGRWLGWAGALLDYTRVRARPSPYDSIIISSLRNAGVNCQNANGECSSGVEAWPDWQAKQAWLAHQIALLQDTVVHNQKRNQVAGQINNTYGTWGGELARYRYRYGNLDQVVNRPTCAVYYFQIGFDTAHATQNYRQAQEALNGGRRQDALQQMAQATNHLRRALKAFDELGVLERSPPPGMVCSPLVSRTDYPQAIQIIISSGAMDLNKLAAATQASALMSDRIGDFLLQNCPRTSARPPVQTRAPDHCQQCKGYIEKSCQMAVAAGGEASWQYCYKLMLQHVFETPIVSKDRQTNHINDCVNACREITHVNPGMNCSARANAYLAQCGERFDR